MAKNVSELFIEAIPDREREIFETEYQRLLGYLHPTPDQAEIIRKISSQFFIQGLICADLRFAGLFEFQ